MSAAFAGCDIETAGLFEAFFVAFALRGCAAAPLAAGAFAFFALAGVASGDAPGSAAVVAPARATAATTTPSTMNIRA